MLEVLLILWRSRDSGFWISWVQGGFRELTNCCEWEFNPKRTLEGEGIIEEVMGFI